ncbi:MAG: 5'-nucleotidase C-terminal domain-containing protein [Peptococcaceae bacterium]|nr:5'-nucleotidase C-terminal domain-containing protein [Peptococcaceae bacterium]
MKSSLFSRRMVALLVAIVLVVSLSSGFTSANSPITLTIFHTNDIHSRVASSATTLGYARIATIVQAERAVNPNVLLLEAGDAFHGQSIANLSRGQAIVDIMNLLQYDAMVPGNHDFNFGQARLAELAGMARFPLLAANVEGKDFQSHVIRTIGGRRIAIIGVATPETAYKTHPRNVVGLTFSNPSAGISRLVASLRPQVDLVVVLAHLGQDGDYTSLALARDVQDIDLIIDGHSHDTRTVQVGRTLIVQAGEFGNHLGRIDVEFTPTGRVRLAHSLIEAADSTAVAQDPRVLEIINRYNQNVNAIHAQVVGSTTVRLEGERALVRTAETNLGNLVTDAMLRASGADFAVTNGGGIRASIPAGQVTRRHVFDVLPFGNLVVTQKIKGAQILELLEFSARLWPAQNGAFLQVAGLTYSIDTTRESGRRVHSVKIKGQPVDLAREYIMATNDFLAAGGDGYAVLATIPVHAAMMSLEETLVEHIEALGGNISPVLENRITLAPMPAVVIPPVTQPEPKPETKPETPPTPPTGQPVQPVQPVIYIVQPGDVLWRIAAKHNTTWEILARHNSLRNPHLIRPNQRIIIPPAA